MPRRSEAEMYDLVLDFARKDERVRLVGLNGSRANPAAPIDQFQDFDVVFLVTDLSAFTASDDWLDVFGERIILQKPEDMQLFPSEYPGWAAYLMLFKDGNRIDLTLMPVADLDRYMASDGIFKLLLDKDGILPNPPASTDRAFWLSRPSCRSFDDCCNEFWWLSTYVAKGLARREFPYAAAHCDMMRRQLLTMLSWQVGLREGFNFSIGKEFKYLERHLPGSVWQALLTTWDLAGYDRCWQATRRMLEMFRRASAAVGEQLGCPYPPYDHSVTSYLDEVYGQYPPQ